MCNICRQTPCHPRCPEAPEPKAIYECINCNAGIYDGDGYYDLNGERWCVDCMKEYFYKIAEE